MKFWISAGSGPTRHILHGQDLADLMDADLSFAARDELGDIAAVVQLGLGLHLAGDAELVEQSGDIDAARTAAAGSI